MQDNLSPDKHIDRRFGDIFRLLRNTYTDGFFPLPSDMVEKNYNYNDQTKTRICRSNMARTRKSMC